MPKVFVEQYESLPQPNVAEILRYAGVRGEADEGTLALLKECLPLAQSAFSLRVCYTELAKEEFFSLCEGAKNSTALCKAMKGAERLLVFAATVGLDVDRLIARYALSSPAKALLLQAMGAEGIERLCDAFCKARKERGLSRRFSPGYGDFPLEAQKDIFRLLNCERHIGLTLTDTLLMSPTKSVTAVVGIGARGEKRACVDCKKIDCEYRK